MTKGAFVTTLQTYMLVKSISNMEYTNICIDSLANQFIVFVLTTAQADAFCLG